MEGLTIRCRLDLLIRLIDATTGGVVEERNVSFRENEILLQPISRGSGNYAFLNMERVDRTIQIEIFGYETAMAEVRYEELDEHLPILEVFLIPRENTSKGEKVLSLSGKLDQIQAIEAVSMEMAEGCIRSFDTKKNIMTVFSNHIMNMDDIHYGLIHQKTQDFESFDVVKTISRSEVKLAQPLKEEFSVNDSVSRIIYGICDQDGNYILRVRDTGSQLHYLVRYVADGVVRFKMVDFHQLEGIQLD